MTSENTQPAAGAIPWWAVFVCCAVLFAGLFDHDLWTPDEPREAALALDMALNGRRVVPHLAGAPFVEKPPLYYAAGAFLLRFAETAAGRVNMLRLGSALWGLAAVAATWLLARRLLGEGAAAPAALFLATFPGFVHVTHWILTDNALMFFTVAAVWALAEAYHGARPLYLAPAAIFTAGAFLSKGLIGPAIITLPAMGLFIPWAFGEARRERSSRRLVWLGMHAFALLAFCGICGAWLAAFKAQAGPELFREWLEANHAGRFFGTARRLGHIAGPWYYIPVLPLYILPGLPAAAAGLWRMIAALRKNILSAPALAPALWGVGGLLLLSGSATKREIYLAVLLPAFGLMAARGIEAPAPNWMRPALEGWAKIGAAIAAAAAAAGIAAPLWSRLLPEFMPAWPEAPVIIGFFGLIAVFAFSRACRTLDAWGKALVMTALLYITALCVCCPAVDRHKSYGPAFTEFADRIRQRGLRPVAVEFDETTRAGLFFYAGLVLPAPAHEAELEAALAGRHSEYTAAAACVKGGAVAAALKGRTPQFEVRLGPRRRLLLFEADAR